MDAFDFAEMIRLARAGDDAATAKLLGQFEAEVRTMVRIRLPRALRNQFDSMDFVQAVWKSVFTGSNADSNPAAFADEGQFRGFLAGVARNKVHEEHRRQTRTKKYDIGREERLYVQRGDREVSRDVAGSDPTPSENAQADDRLGQLVRGRTDQEVEIIILRREGLTYDEVAAKIGCNERSVRRVIDAARKRMEARRWQ